MWIVFLCCKSLGSSPYSWCSKFSWWCNSIWTPFIYASDICGGPFLLQTKEMFCFIISLLYVLYVSHCYFWNFCYLDIVHLGFSDCLNFSFVHYFMFFPLSEWRSLIAVLSPPLLYFVLRSLNLFLLFSGIPGDNGDKFTCLIIDVNRAVT